MQCRTCLPETVGQECSLFMVFRICLLRPEGQGSSLPMRCQNLPPGDCGAGVQPVYAVLEPTFLVRMQPVYICPKQHLRGCLHKALSVFMVSEATSRRRLSEGWNWILFWLVALNSPQSKVFNMIFSSRYCFFVFFFSSLKMSDFFHARSASKLRYRSRMPHHSLKYCHLIVCLPLLLTIRSFNCFGSIFYKQTMKTSESSKDFGRLLSKRRSWGRKNKLQSWSSTQNIDQWMAWDINSNWALKAQKKWELRFARQVLSEIFKAKLSHINVNKVKVNTILIGLRITAFKQDD